MDVRPCIAFVSKRVKKHWLRKSLNLIMIFGPIESIFACHPSLHSFTRWKCWAREKKKETEQNFVLEQYRQHQHSILLFNDAGIWSKIFFIQRAKITRSIHTHTHSKHIVVASAAYKHRIAIFLPLKLSYSAMLNDDAAASAILVGDKAIQCDNEKCFVSRHNINKCIYNNMMCHRAISLFDVRNRKRRMHVFILTLLQYYNKCSILVYIYI